MAGSGTLPVRVPLDLTRNELRNAIVQVLASAPGSPVGGLIYSDSVLDSPYWYSAIRSAWIPLDATKATGIPVAAIAAMAADTLLGNPTGSSAVPTAITIGAGLAFTSGVLNTTGTSPSASNIAGGAANDILYQTATGVTGFITPTNNAVLVTNGSGVPSESTTLPSGLSVSGFLFSTNAAVSAAGTTQGGATALTSDENIVTTVASGAGVALPTAAAGKRVYVVNKGANALLIYPATGGAIDALATNTAISLPVGGVIEFEAASATQWYSTVNSATSTATLVGTISNAQLANSGFTLGSTAVSLGATVTTVAGLVSVTSTAFVGALTGNASTATSVSNALTFGNGFATGSFNGASAQSIILGTPGSVGSGSTNAVTTNSHTHAVVLNSSDVTSGLGYTPVNKAGDTMTGLLVLSANASANLNPVTLQQMNAAIQSASAGISGKGSCVVVATSNVATLSGLATVIDGVTVSTSGDRVLLTGQTTASQNGPWVVASGAWARPTTDANNELETGALWFIEQGTVFAASSWWLNSPVAGTVITPGTTAIGIVQFSAGKVYAAGAGLTLTGNTFAVGAGTGISVSGTTVSVNTATTPQKFVNTSVGNGSSTTITLTHNLGTLAIVVSLINNSTGDIEWCNVNAATTNTCTLTFTTAPASSAYTAVVMG